MPPRIYFDNAATSYPKPQTVYQAVDHYGRYIGASAGRGVYREAEESGKIIIQTRQLLAKLINADDPLSIIMTFNCTDALALAIKGTVTKPGDHVVTTKMEHNSVLRPLKELQKRLGIKVTYVPADNSGIVDPDDIDRAVNSNTRLIAAVHGSNVCGSVQNITKIGQIAKKHGVMYLVDAAQTIGYMTIDVKKINVDLMAFPGHKGLLGPLGTGGLYIRPSVEKQLKTLKEGGTGSKSELDVQPDFMPDRFEAGSHNALGIAGLQAGIQYLLDKGVEQNRKYQIRLAREFLENTENVPKLQVYGPRQLDQRVGVFSVSIGEIEPAKLALILEQKYGLLTRPGLHCAPFAHEAIKTLKRGGTTRFSTGIFNTIDDVKTATNALTEIAENQAGNSSAGITASAHSYVNQARRPEVRI